MIQTLTTYRYYTTHVGTILYINSKINQAETLNAKNVYWPARIFLNCSLFSVNYLLIVVF